MIGSLSDNIKQAIMRFRQDEQVRVLVRASLASFLLRIIGFGTGFLVVVITSRFYGADALGIVSICIAILSFASVFGKMGMDVALMRFIAGFYSQKKFASIKDVFITAMQFIVPASLTISLILFFSSSFLTTTVFHKPGLENIIRTNSFFVLPLVLLLTVSECLRGIEKIRAYTFLSTSAVSTLALILLSVMLIFSTGKLVPVSIQFISISLSAILSLTWWLIFSRFSAHKREMSIRATQLLHTASPMFISSLMQLIMSWAGVLIMAAYYSESQVGIYSAIVRISTFTNITILAINSIASPRLAAAYETGIPDAMKKVSFEASRIIFLSTLPIFLLLILFPHFVLSIFGKDFTGNETALILMLVAQLFVAFAGLPSQILNMAGREKILRTNAILSAIINAGCCFLLIPPYGIIGACIAQVAGMAAWNVLSILSVKKEFGFMTFFRFKI